MSRNEQRVWRGIARSLSEDDPRLAHLISEAQASTVFGARLCAVFVACGLVLILGGLGLHDFQMVMGGLVVLWMMPLVYGLVQVVRRTCRDKR